MTAVNGFTFPNPSIIHDLPHHALVHSSKVLISLCVVGISWMLFKVFVYPYYFSPLRHLPEPFESAGFPWYHAQAFRDTANGVALREWTRTVPNDGIIRIRVFMNRERIFICSPEALKEVLVTKSYEFVKPPLAGFLFKKLLGEGILVADGTAHKAQRKALLPAFSYRHIKDLYPLFWERAVHSRDRISTMIRDHSNSGSARSLPVVVYNWASRVTLDIIGQAGMGWDFDAVDNPEGDIVTTYKLLFENEPAQFRWGYIGIPDFPFWTFYLPAPPLLKARKAAAAVKDVAHNLIRNKHVDFEKSSRGSGESHDILSVAMRSGQFTNEELANQMMTFLAAGHETTASALTWLIYQMCQFPEIQRKLRKEIRTSLPSSADPPPSADEIEKAPYLNAVCNEVLRCMPSVPTTHRTCAENNTILGHHIPKRTRIYISPWATNTDPKLWGEDAHLFNPDRWLGNASNSGGAVTNYANMTFLHGPRSCIGKDFAKAELKCLVAAWLGRFRVSWIDGKALETDAIGYVTVRPKHSLPVHFEDLGVW